MSENKPKKDSFLRQLFKFMFTGRRAKDVSIWEEEQIQSPGKTVAKEFFKRKMTVVAIIGFFVVFTLSMILPFFFPVNDADRETSHIHIRPDITMGMMRLPRDLRGNVDMIAPGPGFSVGLSLDGEVFVWGSAGPETEDVFDVPEFSERVVHVSAGRSHIVATTENGRVYSWGHIHMSTNHIEVPDNLQGRTAFVEAGLRTAIAVLNDGSIEVFGGIVSAGRPNGANINPVPGPSALSQAPAQPFGMQAGATITQIQHGVNATGFLTADGELYIISPDATNLRTVPSDIQGNISDFAITDNNVAVVTADGSVSFWGFTPSLDADTTPISITSGAVSITSDDDDFIVVMTNGNATRFDIIGNQTSATTAPATTLQGHLLEGAVVTGIDLNATSVGFLTADNRVYVFTQGENHEIENIPADIQGRVADFAISNRNGAAVLTDGTIYLWGEGPILPMADFKQGRAVSIRADNTNFAVTLTNGNEHAFITDPSGIPMFWRLPAGVQIVEVEKNSLSAGVLTSDGEIYIILPVDRAFRNVPQQYQGRFTTFALTDRNGAAILDDGSIVVWGDILPIINIPEEAEGRRAIAIEGGEEHLTVLFEDGGIMSWGRNQMGQINYPNRHSDYEQIFIGYHHNYAMRANGDMDTWGLRGFIFGSDDAGRDIFARVWTAGRYSLTIGFVSIVIATIIGIVFGALAGYFGGWVEMLIMRLGEIVMSLPFFPLALIVNWRLQGTGLDQVQQLMVLMVVMGVISWPGIMRLTRAQVMQARNAEYVIGARALGVKESRIISKHIMPNILSVVIVQFALGLAGAMLIESTLSFVGFGITPPTPTWGNMLNAAQDTIVLRNQWWRWVFPAAALVTTVLCINLIGDGLREAFDPRARGR